MRAPGPGVRLAAPAKVNLSLRVLHRRPDGFHELDTLFQAVSLVDGLEVRRAPSGVALRVEGADLGPAEENLAHRAARLFLEAFAPGTGAEITLRKRIPAGAGLGGGSSDAAAVLRALDTLLPGRASREALIELAATLGSDVPFFLSPSPLARGRGRGERLTPLPALPPASIVLILPPAHVATGPAYAALAADRKARGVAGREGDARSGQGGARPPTTWADVAAGAHNDFEEVVAARVPEVGRALRALRAEGADPALMSGSGSACFGFLPDEGSAEAAARRIAAALGFETLACRTLTAFPTPEALGQGG